METVMNLLQGACDIHIHSGPGLIKRSLTHVQAARQAYEAGMRAIVLKDQHCTAQNLGPTIEEALGFERPFSVFGGIALNNTAGGLSPAVVECAIRYGAKAVWMPTLAAAFNRNYHKGLRKEHAASMPKATSKLQYDPDMTLLDSCGNLKQEVVDILRLCADADIIVGNGHVSQQETDLVIDKAKAVGVKKMVINHPELQLRMTLDQMKQYTQAGVYLEHILAIVYSGKSSHEYLYEMIQHTGTEYVVVSSDLGQVGRPVPLEGMKRFVEAMLQLGMPAHDISTVIKGNPTKLLGLNG